MLVLVTAVLGLIAFVMVHEAESTMVEAMTRPSPVLSQPAPVKPAPEPSDAVKQADKWLAGTPMAGLGSTIVATASAKGVDWKLIIGIAEAESGRGKYYYKDYDRDNCHNAWGIKPPSSQRKDGSYLRCYYTWQDGINTIVGILARRYKGWTPAQMSGTYVQPANPNWVRTVEKYTNG